MNDTMDIEQLWQLPGLRRFVVTVRDLVETEGVLGLAADITMPEGFPEAVRSAFDAANYRVETCNLTNESDSYGRFLDLCEITDVARLQELTFDQNLLLVQLPELTDAQEQLWEHRVYKPLRTGWEVNGTGASLLLLNAPPVLTAGLGWETFLGRGDRVIVAEQHLPQNRGSLACELAVSLAVELCGSDFQLIEDLCRASLEDLSDPINWLKQRPIKHFSNCGPLGSSGEHDTRTLSLRVWRAQLASLFPWIEQQRLDFIETYRDCLTIDMVQRETYGVTEVTDLELGALKYQLKHHLDRHKHDRLSRLAGMRNNLAHRKPADPADVLFYLKSSKSD